MSKKTRRQFESIVQNGPAVVADELVHGGAPRRRRLQKFMRHWHAAGGAVALFVPSPVE
jgi:hypothetical protein